MVNNISLNFYENQITGFLGKKIQYNLKKTVSNNIINEFNTKFIGHNGAGKTTVTFMLCGKKRKFSILILIFLKA